MKPSETEVGQAWLGNFDGADLVAATVLLDSLRFVSLSRLRQGLHSHLEELIGEGSVKSPMIAYPERSMEDFEIPVERRARAVAFEDFDPASPIAITPGSEAFVAMVLRDLPGMKDAGRAKGTPWVAPDAGVEGMRERRCRSLLVVTDYMGTGSQVLDLVRAFGRNRTIRSWLSYNWIEIHVVAYASSPEAIERVSGNKHVSGVSVVEAAPTFATASWSADLREAIAGLCRLKCGVAQKWALGYRESGGLFVTERGAPNNLPAICWQDPRRWTPLFERRIVPTGFARQLDDYRSGEPLPDLAERLGQLRLGRNQRLANMRKSSTIFLKALILLNKGPRDVPTLAAELGLDAGDAGALVQGLEQLGFIDGKGAITTSGRAEIAANKRGLRRTTVPLSGSSDPYYPHSLR